MHAGAPPPTFRHRQGPYSITLPRYPPRIPTLEDAASDSLARPPAHLFTLTAWTLRHPEAHGGNTPAHKRKDGRPARTGVCSGRWHTCCPVLPLAVPDGQHHVGTLPENGHSLCRLPYTELSDAFSQSTLSGNHGQLHLSPF